MENWTPTNTTPESALATTFFSEWTIIEENKTLNIQSREDKIDDPEQRWVLEIISR